MPELYVPDEMIDTHQHFWILSERRYDWITPEYGVLNADYGPEDVEKEAAAAGITGTVLVQAADSYEDTFYMLSVAARVRRIKGVVAWAPLDRPDEAEAALDLYAHSPYVCGVRALNHNYDDPRWILRGDVTRGIALLAPRALTLDFVSVLPEHLAAVPELAARHPELTIVLDHMAKPDILNGGWEPWASGMAAAAEAPNVVVKLSGLNTVSGPDWTFTDWQPYVDHTIAHFGAGRTMLGSDWPVSTLAGDFQRVWTAQREVIAHLTEAEQDEILFRTAARVYALGSVSTGRVQA